MKLQLNEVLKGKPIKIKNKEYFSTKDYITPFINKIKTLYTDNTIDFICYVKSADQVSISNNEEDTMFNRVLIQAKINDNNEFNRCICMVYSIDTKTPIVKFYSGWMDNDDRFYMLTYSNLIVNKLEDSTAIDYTPINTLYNSINDNVLDVYNQIHGIYYSKNDDNINLGKWVNKVLNSYIVNDSGKVKLATTVPIDVYKAFRIDKESEYYLSENDGDIQLSKVYNKFLDNIRDDEKDITNKAEKTLLIGKVLELC